MKKERDEYIETVKSLNGDFPGRKQSIDAVENSDIHIHGEAVHFSYVPSFFNDDDWKYLEETSVMTHRILCKVIDKYLHDAEYRKMFNLPAEVERLIMLPCNYDQLLPIGRFDYFLDEEDLSFKFCEFNTDGSGAMSRDYVIGQAITQTQSFKAFAAKHEVEQFDFFDSWAKSFMDIYSSDTNAVENPTIAITDFKESGVFSDFNRFLEAFERAGIKARFVDTRTFEFDGEHLIDPSDGTAINAIYRRAVTSELLQHLDECKALIDAVAAEKVCLIGHFRTTVAHSKMVSIALFDEQTRAFLTEEECNFIDAHVPRTYLLEADDPSCDIAAIKAHKDEWIIKPADDYGAHGVYPGVDFDQKEWERIVDENTNAGYIAQEFYPPRHIDVIRPELIDESDPCKVESWENMPGVYMYDGKPSGIYSRLGQHGVIALDHGGICANTFRVKQ